MAKGDSELDTTEIMRAITKYTDTGVSVMDAVIQYTIDEDLEVEVVGEIIRRSPILKSKIYEEAVDLNMVEKIARLPI